ncbi:MAG: hypothetical protein K0R67_13 [Paenibacillus sp.]|nr:hypothetical protein [Paenibacillus sp.]
MDNFEVLDSSNKRDWDHYLSLMTDKDIYFTSEYCRLYEIEGEQKAELFVYKRDGRLILYPYLLRSIHNLEVMRELGIGGDWYDISTPYGYGGPITDAPSGPEREALFRSFNEVFTAYCRERCIITEFVRFHSLLDNVFDYSAVESQLSRNTAFIDLTVGSESELIQRYCRNHKTNIRKWSSSPLTIRHSSQFADRMDAFTQLYYGTLQDLQADSFYYFPRSFLEDTRRLLEGRLELFEVMHGETAIAACLIMHEFPRMHYHLSGWNRDYLHWAPTKMLIHAAALWGMEAGFEKFHLGGGYSGNDSLYQFKKGFGTNNELDYYLGKRVFFPELYEQIRTQGPLAVQDSAYFPIYRHPQFRTGSVPSPH